MYISLKNFYLINRFENVFELAPIQMTFKPIKRIKCIKFDYDIYIYIYIRIFNRL